MTKTWNHIATDFQQALADLYPQEEIHQLFLMTFEYITHKKTRHYTIAQNTDLSLEEHTQAEEIIQQLQSNKPIQHILGEAHFYGQVFEVSEHTLIPRSETEELVHLIIQQHKNNRAPLRIIDIGTGSGCIPITLALHLPASYTAVELSPETIQVAKRNSLKHKTNIEFIQADILEWDLIFPAEAQFDIIVSNPPYITPKEKLAMHANVLQFEPHMALFVEEETPLLFYDYIADFALSHLTDAGVLYFEINQYLANETATLLRKKGFIDVQIIQDINGADRIIRAQYLKNKRDN